jgi:hypothetical protein
MPGKGARHTNPTDFNSKSCGPLPHDVEAERGQTGNGHFFQILIQHRSRPERDDPLLGPAQAAQCSGSAIADDTRKFMGFRRDFGELCVNLLGNAAVTDKVRLYPLNQGHYPQESGFRFNHVCPTI